MHKVINSLERLTSAVAPWLVDASGIPAVIKTIGECAELHAAQAQAIAVVQTSKRPNNLPVLAPWHDPDRIEVVCFERRCSTAQAAALLYEHFNPGLKFGGNHGVSNADVQGGD